jgi:hypothetical protein
MHRPARRAPLVVHRCGVGAVGLLACALLAVSSAFGQSGRPCTATGSNLNGGPADNVFCGTSGNDVLKGNRGNDELRGLGGNDLLEGGADADQVFGGDGDDRLFGATETGGSDGNDTLSGGAGNDRLKGGDGNDFVIGGAGDDQHSAGDGNDLIVTRDGGLDFAIPFCGSGHDTLDMDLVDAVAYSINVLFLVAGCEAIGVGAVNEGPNVVISRGALRVSEDGRTAVRLRCPASLRQPPRCEGTLRLQLATRRSLRRRAPSARYSLRPGESRRIGVRISQSDRRTFRRRGRTRGMVTSVEGGEFGNKTTVETVALRRPG